MKKSMGFVILMMMLFFLITIATGFAETSPLIQVLKISASDHLAVVKLNDQDIRLVKEGDELTDFGRVIEISNDKIVCRNKVKDDIEAIVIRVSGKNQHIEKISKTGVSLSSGTQISPITAVAKEKP